MHRTTEEKAVRDRSLHRSNVPTERMFGNDRLERRERIAFSLLIDGRHTELIFLSLIQSGDVTFRRTTELTHRTPLARLLVLLLDHVVTDRLPAIVLQATGKVYHSAS